MSTPRKKEATNEQVNITSEEESSGQSTASSEAAKIALEDYLLRVKVHPGLVSSFKIEAGKTDNGLEPRTLAEWASAFDEQTKRTYTN